MTTTSVQPVTTQQIAGKPWKTAPVKSGKGAPATGAERTTKAVAYAYVLGPKRTKNKTNGEPAFFTTGIFDTAKEAPEQAAARAIGERWHKIEPNAGDWEVIFDEDVLHYPHIHPRIPYDRVLILRYKPDAAVYKSEGIDPDTIIIHHKTSWYLTQKWKTNGGSQTKADSVKGS
jgi:hypothetical protein